MALPQGSGFHYSIFLFLKNKKDFKQLACGERSQTVQSLTQNNT